jgi:hypothetical protein
VLNNAPAGTAVESTKASRSPNGQVTLNVTLRRMQDTTNADLIASGESQTNRVLEQRYGLTPRL